MKMEKVSRECRCCQECERISHGEFKKAIDLKASGLSIYVHSDTNNKVEKKRSSVKQEETFVLYNPNEKIIKRYDYISELSQFKTKCYQCKALIQRIRSAVSEISDINANEIRSICQHCKRVNPTGSCKRCEFMSKRFFCNRVKQFEERQIRIEAWLCKVKALLQAILNKNIFCRHKVHQERLLIDEFDKLLKEVEIPLPVYETEIEEIENSGRHNLMKETKDMLDNFLNKLRTQNADILYSSDESLYESEVSASCPCKYLKDKKTDALNVSDTIIDTIGEEIYKTSEGSGNRLLKIGVAIGASRESSTEISNKPGTKKSLKEEAGSKKEVDFKNSGGSKKKQKPKTSGDNKSNKNKDSIGLDESLQLKIKDLKLRKQSDIFAKNKKMDVTKTLKLPKIDDLPIIKPVVEIKVSNSDSIIEYDKKRRAVAAEEMIKGIEIVPFDPHYNDEKTLEIEPLLFKTDPSYYPPTITESTLPDDIQHVTTPKKSLIETKLRPTEMRYKLSNREFINKGWTKLPKTRIMKRVNIYKMIPANLNNDWFSRHSSSKIMFYNTGEKLAEVKSSIRGSWFYKNGSIALDYYPAEEVNAGRRVVIYSNACKEDGDVEKPWPVTVLASFDSLGNGVVYDHYGNIRLKYNQSEGIIFDNKIGPPCPWKWHMLNDPPVLEPVFIDTYTKDRDPRLTELFLSEKNKHDEGEKSTRKSTEEKNPEMIVVELDNFVKVQENKMLQPFKPFQIRMKAMKINNQFSLRILDQTNIYLQFNDGPITMKLDLGMHLISNTIIDTDTADASQVMTPYDKHPPRSRSMADIQDMLKRARKRGKVKSTESKLSIFAA